MCSLSRDPRGKSTRADDSTVSATTVALSSLFLRKIMAYPEFPTKTWPCMTTFPIDCVTMAHQELLPNRVLRRLEASDLPTLPISHF